MTDIAGENAVSRFRPKVRPGYVLMWTLLLIGGIFGLLEATRIVNTPS